MELLGRAKEKGKKKKEERTETQDFNCQRGYASPPEPWFCSIMIVAPLPMLGEPLVPLEPWLGP